jgi:DNA-binding winged helix-turn-helix (wHTH) protein
VEQLTFGPFRLEVSGGRLLREGVDIELRRQALQVLRVLLSNTGRNVGYEQMIREAWEGTLVTRHTVAVTVAEVRKALDEYGVWITHRPKLGYRLEAPEREDWIRKAWHIHNRCTREGFETALNWFQKAAARDSADPRPLEGMCRMYLALGACGMRPPQQMSPAFEAVYRRAVALAGLTPELRLNRGHWLHIFGRRPAEAEAELLQVRKDARQRAPVNLCLAQIYMAVGRLDEAVEIIEEAKEADAFWPIVAPVEIHLYLCRREFDRAEAYGRQALELHPYMGFARLFYGLALELSGKLEYALAEYRQARALMPDLPWLPALEAKCLHKIGCRTEAAELFQSLQQSRTAEYVDAYHMAILRNALGDRHGAFAELERAFQENSAALFLLNVDPQMDSLRRDSRFEQFRKRLFQPPDPMQHAPESVQIAAAS